MKCNIPTLMYTTDAANVKADFDKDDPPMELAVAILKDGENNGRTISGDEEGGKDTE